MSVGLEQGRRWERLALRALSYPANLFLAGVAAFLLALPLVTALSAAAAAARALQRWRSEGDDRVFTGTFRSWAELWRRTLPLSSFAALGTALLALDWLFLGDQHGPGAALLTGALVPVAAVWAMLLVHLPAAIAGDPGGRTGQWVRTAAWAAFGRPLRSVAVGVVVVTWAALLIAVPTLVPVLGISVPVFIGLMSLDDATDRAPR